MKEQMKIKNGCGQFLTFISSSFICAALDMGLAWILLELLVYVIGEDYFRIMVATLLARCVSVAVNFLINQRVVFCREQGTESPSRGKGGSLSRYLALCAVNVVVSASGVYGLHALLGADEKVAKLICDMSLFLIGYQIQKKWVFGREHRSG